MTAVVSGRTNRSAPSCCRTGVEALSQQDVLTITAEAGAVTFSVVVLGRSA